jgi:hypothetical protein
MMHMNCRYPAVVALTSLVLLGATFAPHRPHRRLPIAAQGLRADEIFSTRALRRARTILQLKLLELREVRLERVRRALERGIPIDTILKQRPPGGV